MRHHSLTLLSGLLLVTGLAACNSQPIKRVTPYQGMNYKILLDAYGTPDDQGYIVASEETRYYWKLTEARLGQSRYNKSGSTVSSSGTVSSNPFQNTTIIRIKCTLIVNVDQQNKVTSWEANGAGCRQILFNAI